MCLGYRVTKAMFSPGDLQNHMEKASVVYCNRGKGAKSNNIRKVLELGGFPTFACSYPSFKRQIAFFEFFGVPIRSIILTLGCKKVRPVKSERLRYIRLKAGRPIRGQRTCSNGRTSKRLNKKR